MTAHRPIPPRRATEIFDLAAIAGSIERVVDFAEAGLIKGYARFTETVHANGQREEVRDARISRETWRRVVAEGKAADVATGTVRLAGSAEFGGGPKVNLIGIRFDDGSVAAIAAAHGSPITPAAPAASRQPADRRATTSSGQASPVAPVGPAQSVSRPSPVWSGIPEGAVSISIEEAVKVSGIGRTKLYEVLDKGDIASTKVGRRRMVSVESLRAFLAGKP